MSLRSPSHNKAATYVRSGLFKGLSTFSELERRIELLPTEQERGNAFEVFVEAYLNLDESAQTDEVWVGGRVPAEIRRELNLPASDYGFDGVFRTRLGELVPYQAKFRTGRASLSYRELATFFGITEKAVRRVVITNSVAIVEVAKSRTNFNATRGTDLDRLDAEQLSRIAAWVDGITPPSRVKEPRGYQIAALNDIASEFSAHDRATVVMACGTGKTLVALWAAEKAQAKRVLVLVPSLNLLRQTLHEWAKWTNWGKRFRYLCVCSDSNVAAGLDEIEIHPEDTDFPVETNPALVKRFLDIGDSAVSVVFCTYHSAPVIGDALQGIAPFDLGIFDEAHKTTGREGTRFAFALSDKNLPIKKRLFLTATPRHYNIRKRDKEGDFEVASMDNETQYGRVAHRLTFSRAVAQKIIVPYKIVISVVDSNMINNVILDQSDVAIKGDPVRAKWVAQQVALKRAVEAHDVRRIITFHSRVAAAAAFASSESEGVGFYLPEFQRFHVSGKQPTAERDEKMRDFSRVHRGVITNARCLTEGVDVPSVDMVAFMDPRRSRVDIVQAVGRAMRTAGEHKTCGYVLVPLFLEMQTGETLTEALERSDFDEIAQVLNAMSENDDELIDIIQALSIEKGRTGGGFDESRLREKVELLGPQIQFDELSASIYTRLLNELGCTWDERYGQLLAYKQLHGDCNLPAISTEYSKLIIWCNTQREYFKLNELPSDRIKRLEDIGFVWYRLSNKWEKMFAALVKYKQTHGDCNVPALWADDPELAIWCTNQRARHGSSKQLPDRIKRLEQLGFVWDQRGDGWEQMFAALVEYKQTHGDCNVPNRFKDNPEFGTWCANQRSRYVSGKQLPDRIMRLEGIGFVWDQLADAWEKMFATLVEYKQIHGDCNVPNRFKENPELGTWCGNLRFAYKKGKVPSDRIQRLEQLGFVWDQLADAWEKMFATLVEYKQIHGDCNVSLSFKENPELGTWCSNQRSAYKNGNQLPDRIKRLEQIGFPWTPRVDAWETMFAALVEYKKTHGDCNVPVVWAENRKLGNWCSQQKSRYRNLASNRKQLSPDRIKKLSDLGFRF